jgi:hypothetical protein
MQNIENTDGRLKQYLSLKWGKYIKKDKIEIGQNSSIDIMPLCCIQILCILFLAVMTFRIKQSSLLYRL